MAGSRLQQLLIGKIDFYLSQDNAEPKKADSWLEQAVIMRTLLFSPSSGAGRQRALQYKSVINLSNNDYALAREVLKDITMGESVLATSKVLRLRLLEGLCDYYSIQSDAIQMEVQRQISLNLTLQQSQSKWERAAMATLISSMLSQQQQHMSISG